MRILYLDIDSLRADHLGSYGYHRPTTPVFDGLAGRGARFEGVYASDVPCLPSRTALFTGRPGIQTGVVSHGGRCADPWNLGPLRQGGNRGPYRTWMTALRQAGYYPASITAFAVRHAAWHFYDGFREIIDSGRNGLEHAGEITPLAIDWLRRNSRREKWFLHVNLWDPHTPYRTPLEFGEPFADHPPPGWLTVERIARQREGYGPHSARDLEEWGPNDTARWPRLPAEIAGLDDYRRWIDGYDTGILFADTHAGYILDELAAQGLLDETLVVVSADHGENQGELDVYGDHHTADECTGRVPLIIAGPGVQAGVVDRALRYHLDLAPTVCELAGAEPAPTWQGRSFAPVLAGKGVAGRDHLVITQGAWTCQRGVRFDRWLLLRTYDPGLKEYPEVMLFEVSSDPHQTQDLAAADPAVVAQGLNLLGAWEAEQITISPHRVDPLQTVLAEGGPFYTRGHLAAYLARLQSSGRLAAARRLEARSGTPSGLGPR
jgi:arylsulfatase A-like enzyme